MNNQHARPAEAHQRIGWRGGGHPLVELTLSRFREFVREPEAVFWVFAFPGDHDAARSASRFDRAAPSR